MLIRIVCYYYAISLLSVDDVPEFDSKKARYIQNTGGIDVSETHFISREGAKLHDYPTFWYNNGMGSHYDVVKFRGGYYLTQTTIKPYPEPIPYGISGRD